jgi:hypothetical protein
MEQDLLANNTFTPNFNDYNHTFENTNAIAWQQGNPKQLDLIQEWVAMIFGERGWCYRNVYKNVHSCLFGDLLPSTTCVNMVKLFPMVSLKRSIWKCPILKLVLLMWYKLVCTFILLNPVIPGVLKTNKNPLNHPENGSDLKKVDFQSFWNTMMLVV